LDKYLEVIKEVEASTPLIPIVIVGDGPKREEFFLILNVAMGGTFGGSVDPAFTSSTMEVDYIRIYK
jgi:hypothetical protein